MMSSYLGLKIRYLLQTFHFFLIMTICNSSRSLNDTELAWHKELLDTVFGSDNNLLHNSCIQKSDYACCDCDEYCKFKGTCCIDAFFEWNPSQPSTYLNMFVKMTKVAGNIECRPIIPNEPKRKISSHIMVNRKCPKSIISRKDQSNEDSITKTNRTTWYFLGADDTIYYNRHYAECNNQTDAKFLKINAKSCILINASNSANDTSTLGLRNFSNCIFSVEGVNNDKFECQGGIERGSKNDAFEETGNCSKQESDLCLFYNARVMYKGKTFANRHCLKCLFGASNYTKKECRKIPTGPKIGSGYRLTIQMFNNVRKTEIFKPTCQPGFKWLYESNVCIDVGSGSGKKEVLPVSPMVPNVPDIGILKYNDFLFRLSKTFDVNVFVIFKIIDSLEILNKWLVSLDQSEMKMIYNSSKTPTNIYKSSKNLTFDAILKIINNIIGKQYAFGFTESKVVLSPLKDLRPNIIYGESMENMFHNYKVCADANVSSYNLSKCSNSGAGDCKLDFDAILNLSTDNQSIFWIDINKTGLTYYLAQCNLFHLYSDCASTFYKNGTFQVLKDGEIQLIAKMKDLGPSNYNPGLDGVYACHEKPAKPKFPWEEDIIKIEYVISTIGACISIFSLCLTIYTYMLFEQLMTTPGKNLVSLCVSVLMSDIIILIQINCALSEVLCKVFGAMLHWSLLSCHIWGLVFVIDLYRTFRSTVLQQSKRRFMVYSAGSWMTSTIIVIVCASTSSYHNILESNGSLFCFLPISISWVAFMAPVICCLIVAFIFATLSIYNIRKTSRDSSATLGNSAQRRNPLNMLTLAIRVVLLLGLFEVLGLIQLQSNGDGAIMVNAIMGALYSILRSLRGWLIFLSFVFKRNILNMYLEKIGSKVNVVISTNAAVKSDPRADK